MSHLFEVNFNIDYTVALLIMVAITGVYLILGGYFAVTLTDFIQGLIMILGSILMVAILLGKGGGLSDSISTLSQNYAQHVPKPPTSLVYHRSCRHDVPWHMGYAADGAKILCNKE